MPGSADRRSRTRVGDLFAIELSDRTYGFGRMLPLWKVAFYSLHSKELPDAADVGGVLASPVLFALGVERFSYDARRTLIGNFPLEQKLKMPVRFFREDFTTKQFFVYEDGRETPATADARSPAWNEPWRGASISQQNVWMISSTGAPIGSSA